MKTTDDHGAPVRLAIAFVLILALVWLVTGIASAAESEGGRPNVLLILCDDCGYGDVTPALTPSLTALANDSARFTDAYANSLCSPAERYNLAGANGARVATMTQMINVWKAEVGR